MISMKPRAIAIFLLGLCAALPPGPGTAAELKISPLRLTLGTENPIDVVTVANPGSEPVLLQVRLRAWSHPDGQDRFEDSRDVLANPTVFELEPGQQQVVRVGLTRPLSGTRELSYRIFIQQLPRQDAEKSRQVSTLLTLALPLFVAPRDSLPPNLAWRVEPRSATEIAVQVENRGNTHAEVSSLALSRQGGEQVAAFDRRIYVLPGQRRELVLPGGALGVAERLTLTASTGRDGRIETALRVGTVAPVEEALR
ncbi:MAG: fimbria/pilus periplasmic chaperone [Rhodospirillales bacterium]|nr:fimbria/pilus periplasmic chaperone [Rhodospirillales bacterium]